MRDSGRLGERQIEVLTVLLYNEKPMTGQEVTLKVPSGWKRLSELEKMGFVREVGTRICSVTGEKAAEWAIEENQPGDTQIELL